MRKPEFCAYLDGNGSSPYAARADHKHDAAYAAKSHNHDTTYEPKNAALLKASAVEVAVESWSEGSASVAFPSGLTTFVCYQVSAGSASAATAAGLALASVGDDGLVFTVTETPASALNLFVLYT